MLDCTNVFLDGKCIVSHTGFQHVGYMRIVYKFRRAVQICYIKVAVLKF